MADEMDKSRGEKDKDRAPQDQSAEITKSASDGAGAAEMSAPQDSEEAAISASGSAERADGSRIPGSPVDAAPSPKSQADAAPAPPAATASQRGGGEPSKTEVNSVNSAESSHSSSGGLDTPGLELLYDVELDATLQFGSKEMLLRDVLELGPGDVVELDRHIAEPVDLVVGDRIVARGEVVVASGNFALRVTEVATPQMRLESIRCLF